MHLESTGLLAFGVQTASGNVGLGRGTGLLNSKVVKDFHPKAKARFSLSYMRHLRLTTAKVAGVTSRARVCSPPACRQQVAM